jgi:GAF domain-containing protein
MIQPPQEPGPSDASKPLSDDEPARLQEIADLDLLSWEEDPALDGFAREAAERFGVPVSLVSIVLDGAQDFAGSHGLRGWLDEVQGTPAEWSFCAFAVRARDVFVVEDATVHPLVKDNPLVRIDGIRSYAGAPLLSSRGHVLGTLCVIGAEPRRFTPEELDDLRALARRVVEHLETRRKPAAPSPG